MKKVFRYVIIISYISIILHITIFSRVQTLENTVRLVPFWSFVDCIRGNCARGVSILLNIGLFVPLGYLLALPCDHYFTITKSNTCLFPQVRSEKTRENIFRFGILIISLLLSLEIESIQYYYGYGTFDIDDILCNCLGCGVGLTLFEFSNYYIKNRVLICVVVPIALLMAGFYGQHVFGSRLAESNEPLVYERQFYFDVTEISDSGEFFGMCDVYSHRTPKYKVALVGDNVNIHCRTTIEGEFFKACPDIEAAGQYEVMIQFNGFRWMPTSVFLDMSNKSIKYSKDVPPANFDHLIANDSLLKACSLKNDIFVFEENSQLTWLFGPKVSSEAWIIYHVYTNEPENLPFDREKYGFDNFSFKLADNVVCDTKTGYRIMKTNIPLSYNVSAICVGYRLGSDIMWEQFFRA